MYFYRDGVVEVGASREIAADVITVERNSAAKSIRKIIIYTVNRRLIFFFFQMQSKRTTSKAIYFPIGQLEH